ncbi:hypothetical protein ACLKA6_017850 [Drosophila palustris]
MVKLRIGKFCFCISLRHGCIGIACFDFIVRLLIIFLVPGDLMYQSERAVAICHCIGCVMLLLGALIESTVLLIFYLITLLVNDLILIICFIIVSAQTMAIRWNFLLLILCVIGTSIYFYLVAYSYYVEVNSPYGEEDEDV